MICAQTLSAANEYAVQGGSVLFCRAALPVSRQTFTYVVSAAGIIRRRILRMWVQSRRLALRGVRSFLMYGQAGRRAS